MTLARLLRSDDLEELAGLAADYEPSAADEQAVGAVLAEWSDVQAVANLLMYPRLIPADKRVAALVRGLCDDEGYLRLAAAVGVGQLPPEDLDDDDAVQLALPFQGADGTALDHALDDVRERFGTGAVSRAVLPGRDEGWSVPMLPD